MKASGYDRHANDWYQEPTWAVDGLIAVERPFIGRVLDPCCGEGNIPDRLRAAGMDADGSELVQSRTERYHTGIDFFAADDDEWFFRDCVSIVSNPPYDRAQEFVTRALTLTTDRVCCLLRLAFLEGQKRGPWLDTTPLARVWVSSRRMSMPPGGTGVVAKGGAVAFAWFVWERGWRGPAHIGRF